MTMDLITKLTLFLLSIAVLVTVINMHRISQAIELRDELLHLWWKVEELRADNQKLRSALEVNALKGRKEVPQVEGIPTGGSGKLPVEDLPLGLEGSFVEGGAADIASSRKLFLNELAEVISTALSKEREIYEAGTDRRLNDLRSFLKREIRLTY